MKKIFIYTLLTLLLIGCANNRHPQKKEPNSKPIQEENKVEKNVSKKEIKKKKPSKISFTFYRIIPNKIEIFPYNELYKNTIVDDKKLNDSFYIKGRLLRIEKIYTSKIGDKYGKIVGKNLLVSMDDLRKN